MIVRIILFLIVFSVSSISFAAPVNINQASAEQISEALNGIGPSKAAAIIEYREENGPFRSVDELTGVKGIGQKIIDKNRANIIVKPDDDMSS